jgi:hypothetical protein
MINDSIQTTGDACCTVVLFPGVLELLVLSFVMRLLIPSHMNTW